MQVNLIRSEELDISRWSGGTTTQLAIFPSGSEYAARNFTWRVSSAQVEALESVFTPLAGVKRILMVLDGHLALTHEGHYSRNLGQFEQDTFWGDWTTRSLGRVRDFNVMMRGCDGSLDVFDLPAGVLVRVAADRREGFSRTSLVLYFLSGNDISVEAPDLDEHAHQGDVLVATLDAGESPPPFVFRALSGDSKVVIARIFHG